jgi:probable F420-dependent oxidoreductase
MGEESVDTSLELARLGARAGFDDLWITDSHVIWREPFTVLGYLARELGDQVRLGTMVTNPQTRHPTVLASAFGVLNELTGGRSVCGIGRGDSAVRVMKMKPANLDVLERAIIDIRRLAAGQAVDVDGVEVRLPWATGGVPVYVAAYGPKALRVAGRVGDGVILQIADEYFVEWALEQVRAGAEEVGRDLEGFAVQCATYPYISDDLEEARERTRPFGAVVGNHVADILRHHDPDALPGDLAAFVAGRKGYDYSHHGKDADQARYVPDALIDRFCLIGSVGECKRRIRALAALGVTEINLYRFVEGIESVVETYARDIIPELRAEAPVPA